MHADIDPLLTEILLEPWLVFVVIVVSFEGDGGRPA
eukprot:SAG31_NODE_270_length_18732_cov_9.342618_14_plen_36_part_00